MIYYYYKCMYNRLILNNYKVILNIGRKSYSLCIQMFCMILYIAIYFYIMINL